MKKVLLCVACVALCMMLFPLVAYAHSGKTDSNGGHYDHSTGEYHYHHGYSAHQHYDIDGDGYRDCPYNFEDKTSHGNNSSGNEEERIPTTSKGDSYDKVAQPSGRNIFFTILSIIGYSVLAWAIGLVTFIIPLLYWLLLAPAEVLIKKHCKEDSQDKMLERFCTIVTVLIDVAIVVIVTIIVIN